MQPSMKMSRRRILIVVGVGGAASLLAACQPAPAAAPTAAPAAKPTEAPKPAAPAPTTAPAAAAPTAAPAVSKPATVTLAKPEMASFTYGMNNPNYATQIVHFVALENGYFKEVGFDKIEVITGEEYLPGVVGGSLLMAQGDTDAAFGATNKGENVPLLAIFRQKEFRILGVAKGIETAADLKGKQLSGGPPGGRNEFLMKQIVSKLGLDPEKDVEWVSVRGASDARLQAIVAGQLSGASLFPRHEGALKEAGGKFLVKDFADAPQECFMSNASMVEKNPNLITAYLSASVRAAQWLAKDEQTILKNKTEALAIMEKHGFKISDDFKQLYESVEMLQISPDLGFPPAAMDQLLTEAAQIGTLPQGFDWRKAVNLTMLNKAQVAAGVPERPKL
jgi:ABC-type nitrate/sulfonate/bicarbonate transport system substrate-binding protein